MLCEWHPLLLALLILSSLKSGIFFQLRPWCAEQAWSPTEHGQWGGARRGWRPNGHGWHGGQGPKRTYQGSSQEDEQQAIMLVWTPQGQGWIQVEIHLTTNPFKSTSFWFTLPPSLNSEIQRCAWFLGEPSGFGVNQWHFQTEREIEPWT